jgi:hypothetical protein
LKELNLSNNKLGDKYAKMIIETLLDGKLILSMEEINL